MMFPCDQKCGREPWSVLPSVHTNHLLAKPANYINVLFQRKVVCEHNPGRNYVVTSCNHENSFVINECNLQETGLERTKMAMLVELQ